MEAHGYIISQGDPNGRWIEASRCLVGEIIPVNPKGFTFDPRELILSQFDDDVYTVSIHGFERRFVGSPSIESLSRWVTGCGLILLRPSFYIGGWENPSDGSLVMDVSTSIRGLNRAVQFGLAQNQIAIFHPAHGETICLDATSQEMGIGLDARREVSNMGESNTDVRVCSACGFDAALVVSPAVKWVRRSRSKGPDRFSRQRGGGGSGEEARLF